MSETSVMDDVDLESLSVAELEDLQSEISATLAERTVAEKAEVKREIEELLEEHGLRLDQVFEELAPKKRGRRPSPAAQDGTIGNGHDPAHD